MSEPRRQTEEAAELRHLHPSEEGDPEELAGDPMPDPWADDKQTDWPTELLDMPIAPNGAQARVHLDVPGEEGGG